LQFSTSVERSGVVVMKHFNVFAVAVSLISVLGFAACAGSAPSDSNGTGGLPSGTAGGAVVTGFAISQFSPPSGTYSSIPSQVQVLFNQTNINTNTANLSSNWTLTCGAQIFHPNSVSSTASVATLMLPAVNLANGTSCVLSASAAVLDLSNNSLSTANTANYTISVGAPNPGAGTGNTGYNPQNNLVTATSSVGGSGGNYFGEAASYGYSLFGLQLYSDGIVERMSPVWGSNYGSSPNYYNGGVYGKPTGTYTYLSCGSNNSRAVGIFGHSGAFVDQIGLICKPQDGSAGDATYSKAVGGPGGSGYQLLCPSGTFVMGLYGRSGSGLDQIGLTCQ
jgi:hypothetical protein